MIRTGEIAQHKVCLENPDTDPFENVFNYPTVENNCHIPSISLLGTVFLSVLAIVCYTLPLRLGALNAGNSILKSCIVIFSCHVFFK
jgi:hypothetical protein